MAEGLTDVLLLVDHRLIDWRLLLLHRLRLCDGLADGRAATSSLEGEQHGGPVVEALRREEEAHRSGTPLDGRGRAVLLRSDEALLGGVLRRGSLDADLLGERDVESVAAQLLLLDVDDEVSLRAEHALAPDRVGHRVEEPSLGEHLERQAGLQVVGGRLQAAPDVHRRQVHLKTYRMR